MVPAEERPPPRPSAAAGRFWGSRRCGRGMVANHARMSAPTWHARRHHSALSSKQVYNKGHATALGSEERKFAG